VVGKNVLLRAIKSAERSNVVRGKVGAVAFLDNGTIITCAHNSSFFGSKLINTIHAEQALLNKLDKLSANNRWGNNINILVIRWCKGTQRLANSKPCNSCTARLRKYDFKVYYSNEDGEIERYYELQELP